MTTLRPGGPRQNLFGIAAHLPVSPKSRQPPNLPRQVDQLPLPKAGATFPEWRSCLLTDLPGPQGTPWSCCTQSQRLALGWRARGEVLHIAGLALAEVRYSAKVLACLMFLIMPAPNGPEVVPSSM